MPEKEAVAVLLGIAMEYISTMNAKRASQEALLLRVRSAHASLIKILEPDSDGNQD